MAKRAETVPLASAPASEMRAHQGTSELIAEQLRRADALLCEVLEAPEADEPLHDFRVALRRARSFVSLLGRVYPKRARAELADALRSLAAPTGPSRDLDVHLLARKTHLKALPRPLRDEGKRVFERLTALRAQEKDALRAQLGSEGYVRMLVRTREMLEGGGPPEGPRAREPFGREACRSIERRYVQVIERGRSLDHATKESRVHRYRIACKKLRYALEFFAPDVEGAKCFALLTRRLKAAQTQLGHFNDCCVQRDRLLALDWSESSARVVLAAGAMAGVLQSQIAASRGPLIAAAAALAEPELEARVMAALQRAPSAS